MDKARCTEDGVIYTAINFAQQLPDDFDRKRRLLQCPECGGPAFFRNTSFNGRAACFGSRPHAVSCNLSAYDPDQAIYDAIDDHDILSSHIIVDLGYGSQLPIASGWSISATNGIDNFGSQWPSASTNRRLSSLLRSLIKSPALQNSDQLVEAHGEQGIPARDFFVPLLNTNTHYAGQQRGYWGLISDAKLTENTLWLNSGKRATISFGLDIKFVDYFARRFHLNELEDLAGAMILVIGTPSIAKNGKLHCMIEDIEFMTLRLT